MAPSVWPRRFLLALSPPLMVKTPSNPEGTPIEVFNKLRASVVADRSQFWKDLSLPLKKIDVPTLILHGDEDQIVPIQASALQSVKLIKGAELKIYKGAPHGMCTTRKEEVNADLLSFFQTKVSVPGKRAA